MIGNDKTNIHVYISKENNQKIEKWKKDKGFPSKSSAINRILTLFFENIDKKL